MTSKNHVVPRSNTIQAVLDEGAQHRVAHTRISTISDRR